MDSRLRGNDNGECGSFGDCKYSGRNAIRCINTVSKISRPNNGAIYFIIALLAIPLLAGAFYLGVDKGRFDRAPYNHTQHYSEYTDAEIGNICGASTTKEKAIECAIKNKTKYRDAKRAELELAAQQEMARWAEYLLYVSIFSLAVSIFGLTFIGLTLDQNTKAAKEANRSNSLTRVQQRSWVKIHMPKKRIGDTVPNVIYEIENVGILTAVDVSIRVKVFTSSWRWVTNKASSYFLANNDAAGEPYEIEILLHNDPIGMSIGIGNPDYIGEGPEEGTFFVIMVRYRTDEDKAWRSSSRVYGLNDGKQPNKAEILGVGGTRKYT